jgi:hypothetical protein
VLNFKARAYAPTDLSHRTSQDNLTQSINLRKDKAMSQTDPTGHFYQAALGKRTSGFSSKPEPPV